LEFKGKEVKDKQRVSKYKQFQDKYKLPSNIKMTSDFNDYKKVEDALDISMNVWTWKHKNPNTIEPLYINKSSKERHADGLLIENENGKKHYLARMDINRLLESFVTKNHKVHSFCLNCQKHFTTEDNLNKTPRQRMLLSKTMWKQKCLKTKG